MRNSAHFLTKACAFCAKISAFCAFIKRYRILSTVWRIFGRISLDKRHRGIVVSNNERPLDRIIRLRVKLPPSPRLWRTRRRTGSDTKKIELLTTDFADFFAFESAFAKAMADKIGFELALFCIFGIEIGFVLHNGIEIGFELALFLGGRGGRISS